MTPKGKKVLIISSIVILLIAIIVVVILIIKAGKKGDNKDEGKKKEEDKSSSDSNNNTNVDISSYPFTTVEEGNKFRAWVNDTYPDYAREIDLDREGKLNAYLQRAWEKHGAEYTKKVLNKK